MSYRGENCLWCKRCHMLQCMLWSWYLANDTQFYIIGILILLVSVRFDTSLSVSMQHVFSCFYYIIIIFYCFMRKFIQVIQKSQYFKYRQPVKVTAALCNQLVQPSAIVIRNNSPVHNHVCNEKLLLGVRAILFLCSVDDKL